MVDWAYDTQQSPIVHPVRWSSSGQIELLAALSGQTSGSATGINASGTIVGHASTATENLIPVYWANAGLLIQCST